jgi:hypothetical protein
MRFKQYLSEASFGAAKWDKYFSSGDTETIARADSALKDVFGKVVTKTIRKGEKLTVISTEFSANPRVRIGDGEYTMPFTNIDKPFKLDREVSTELKPDKLGLFGPMFIAAYGKRVKQLLDAHSEIPETQTEYLKSLIDLAEDPSSDELADVCRDLYIMSGTADDQAFKNTINNDFMEVLGPYIVIMQKPEYKAGGVKFPEAGNEPLYDFTMKAKQGPDVRIDAFSSKRSGGNTNTLKVTEILKAAAADVSLNKKYRKELELLNIIADKSVKLAPDAINDWLGRNFPAYTPAPPTTDTTTIARLEAAVVKWINASSGLNFTPLVQAAVPDLWYVKAKLNSDGTFKAEPLKSGRDIEKANLRSKSSPGHLSDKIGFAL